MESVASLPSVSIALKGVMVSVALLVLDVMTVLLVLTLSMLTLSMLEASCPASCPAAWSTECPTLAVLFP